MGATFLPQSNASRVLDGDITVTQIYVPRYKQETGGRLPPNEAIAEQLKPLFAVSFVCKFSRTAWNLPENDKSLAKLLITQGKGWNQTVTPSFPGGLRWLMRQAPAGDVDKVGRAAARPWHLPRRAPSDAQRQGPRPVGDSLLPEDRLHESPVKTVLERRVSMRVEIITGFPNTKSKKIKMPTFYFHET